MTDLRAEWKSFVADRLEPLTPKVCEALQALISQPYPPEVSSLDFELFPDGFTDGFPARVFFMDANNCEFFVSVEGHPRYPSDVDPGLVEIDHVYSVEEEEAFLARPGCDAIEDELWDLSTETFMNWFARCWLEVGGQGFRLNASIMVHDDLASMRTLVHR